MPYINPAHRMQALISPVNSGELNYAITSMIHDYVKRRGLNYDAINDVMGALTGVDREFYRTVAAPYEDSKLLANGSVSRLTAEFKRKLEYQSQRDFNSMRESLAE